MKSKKWQFLALNLVGFIVNITIHSSQSFKEGIIGKLKTEFKSSTVTHNAAPRGYRIYSYDCGVNSVTLLGVVH
jgi:hypothetical protein